MSTSIRPIVISSPLVISRLANGLGVLYGSVSVADVQEALLQYLVPSQTEEPFTVAQLHIEPFEPIKSVGKTTIIVNNTPVEIKITSNDPQN